MSLSLLQSFLKWGLRTACISFTWGKGELLKSCSQASFRPTLGGRAKASALSSSSESLTLSVQTLWWPGVHASCPAPRVHWHLEGRVCAQQVPTRWLAPAWRVPRLDGLYGKWQLPWGQLCQDAGTHANNRPALVSRGNGNHWSGLCGWVQGDKCAFGASLGSPAVRSLPPSVLCVNISGSHISLHKQQAKGLGSDRIYFDLLQGFWNAPVLPSELDPHAGSPGLSHLAGRWVWRLAHCQVLGVLETAVLAAPGLPLRLSPWGLAFGVYFGIGWRRAMLLFPGV